MSFVVYVWKGTLTKMKILYNWIITFPKQFAGTLLKICGASYDLVEVYAWHISQ